jgi:hypothetical protein
VANALQPVNTSPQALFGLDAVIAKLSPDGTQLVFSTFLGGSSDDAGYGVAVDGEGNIHVAGNTFSADFPVVNAFQPAFAGGLNALGAPADWFAAKLDPEGTRLLYSTYLGGSGPELTSIGSFYPEVVLDQAGHAYITGNTASADFPVTPDALQSNYNGGDSDAFLSELDQSGKLVYSTYLGGFASEMGVGLAVDRAGYVWISGWTRSENFPVSADALQPAHRGGGDDVFVAQLDPGGKGLLFSTFLGGSGGEAAVDLAWMRRTRSMCQG